MCVYNGEKFLRKQLDSVLNQTYTNFELLCLDDKSTDSSVAILADYQQKDNKVKVFLNDVNLGFNKNFEKGISLSNGEFIAICDQDDIWLPHKIEELIDSIGDNSLIYSNSTLIDEKDQELECNLDHTIRHIDNPSYKAFLEANFITGHTCLLKKELVKFILPFPNNLTYYDWWIGFAASYTGSIKYLDKILTKHRVHKISATQLDKDKNTSRSKRNAETAKQIQSFLKAAFVTPSDKKFIARLLAIKANVFKSPVSYMKCFIFLSKNFGDIFPWYTKTYFSKLNFIRKRCS